MKLQVIEKTVSEYPELQTDESLLALISLYRAFATLYKAADKQHLNRAIHLQVLRRRVVQEGYSTDSICEHLFKFIFDYEEQATLHKAVTMTLRSIYIRIFYLTHRHYASLNIAKIV